MDTVAAHSEHSDMTITKSAAPIQQRVYLFERLYADMKANQPYGQGGDIRITISLGGDPDNDRVETNKPNFHEFRSYLLSFRQLISPRDPVFLGGLLDDLPAHVHDPVLRKRLRRARKGWAAAQGIPSFAAPLALGPFAGKELARLYLYGGIFHSDPDLVGTWDVMSPNQREFVEWAFRQYEAKVRDIIVELKRVIEAARERGHLRDEEVDPAVMADEATVHRGVRALTFNSHELEFLSGELEQDDDQWTITAMVSRPILGPVNQTGWTQATLEDGSSFRGYGGIANVVATSFSGAAPTFHVVLVAQPPPEDESL